VKPFSSQFSEILEKSGDSTAWGQVWSGRESLKTRELGWGTGGDWGVVVGLGVGDGLGVAVGKGVGTGVAVGKGVGTGVAVGKGVGTGVAVGKGVGTGVGVAAADVGAVVGVVGLRVAVPIGVGEGIGVNVGKGVIVGEGATGVGEGVGGWVAVGSAGVCPPQAAMITTGIRTMRDRSPIGSESPKPNLKI